jgi:hypothetical protein
MEEYKRLETILLEKGADVRRIDAEAKENARKILREMYDNFKEKRAELFRSLTDLISQTNFDVDLYVSCYIKAKETLTNLRKMIGDFQSNPPGFGKFLIPIHFNLPRKTW